MNLVFLCGPHGGGKTTLCNRIRELCPDILVPELSTATPKFHTSPYQRILLKVCQRSIENYEALEIAEKNPDKLIVGNRCLYDGVAYLNVYRELGWVTECEFDELSKLTIDAFIPKLRNPKAVVLNPPFEVVREHLERRWSESGMKWNEDNLDYSRFACEAYKRFEGNPDVLYVRDNDCVDRVVGWLGAKVINRC